MLDDVLDDVLDLQQFDEKNWRFLKRKHRVRNQNACRFILWLRAV